MKRLTIFRGGVAMALMLGILVAITSSAEASPSGQLGALTRQGLSLKRAQAALATQSQVETADLPTKLEEALGASFAGVWFEPNTAKLCIGVVSGASRRAAEQVVAQAGLAGVVSYVPVRSTWAQLVSGQREWTAKFVRLAGQQFSTGLTASNNAVSMTLSSSVPAHERALLEREAARFHVNVSITVVPAEQLEARHENSQCEVKPRESYAYCSKPIAAGVLITPNVKLTTYCTAGPLAILANPLTLAAELETFIVTAGHCLEGTEKWYSLTHPVNEHIEIGPTRKFLNDLLGDYGAIEITNSNWLLPGTTPALAQMTHYEDNGLREAQNVLGEAASVQNASVCHQGATSAEQCGTITELNALVNFEDEGGGLLHVTGLVKTNACSEGGDSGGPYATLPNSNGVDILGTHVGGSRLVGHVCSGLFCSDCATWYEPIKTSLTALGLTLLTTSNQTRHKPLLQHPLFLTASGQELSFTGGGSNAVLRAEAAGIQGTIECTVILITGSILPKSPLVHRIHISLHTDCLQTISGNKTACSEPILLKLALGEIGLLVGKKEVLIKLEPDDGTGVFGTITCGGMSTIVRGAVLGQIPEINAKAVNQYNKLLTESEQVYQSVGKNSVNQSHTEIELLGVVMTKEELTAEGFFSGKVSLETIIFLQADGGVEICTFAPQNCP